MSTSDKLTYLNGTKQALKESINNIGGSITDETTFRAYATELDNIYSNIPKTTGTGSNLSLTTLKGRINVDDILGDTTQEGTPTPSSPQDINVVTGEQQVLVQNYNLLEGIEYGEIYAQSGEEYSANATIRAKNYMRYFTNKTYYAVVNGTINTSAVLNLRFYNKNKEYIGYSTLLGSGSNFNITIGSQVTTTDLTPVYFRFRETLSAGPITSIDDKVMITTINTTSYVEHQEQTNTIHLGDIELAKIGTYQDRIFETSGKNKFDIGTSLSEWFATANNGLTIVTESVTRTTATISNETLTINSYDNTGYSWISKWLILEPNTDYIISGTNDNDIKIIGFASNELQTVGTMLAQKTSSNTTKTFNSGNYAYYCLSFYPSATGKKFSNIMIAKGSTALPYEPYGSDKWYIEKNIEKRVFNGTETYWNTARGTSPYVYAYPVNNYMRTQELVLICNYFIAITNGTYGSMETNQTRFRYYTDTDKAIYFCTSDITTLADFKTWLSTHNTEVRYVLSTPTYEEITNETLLNELNEIEKLMSYNGTTNINISGNLPMILSASALKGESE